MAHKVRVNAGQVQIALPDGEVYDGPVEVVLSDEEFSQISGSAFPTVLTDLGTLPDPDIDADFVTEAEMDTEVGDVVRKPATPVSIANPTGGLTADAESRTAITAILGVLRDRGLIAP